MMLKWNLPLECKTVSDWHEEVKRQAYHFREKYENSYRRKLPAYSIIQFYRNAGNTYAELCDLLNHLIKYNGPTSHECLSCRHTPGHADKLEYNYKKYYKQIMRCRDGFHYSKNSRGSLHAF